ncbi:TOBE domain-containing protein [Neokomagataea tanensis]|uniref:TOBE domain-containing protein n=1 Tax=Neokomagataea tanensis TaxID=661191 RepID=A0A4Y6VAX7_9PROT|nr:MULTISPECIES: TOBE domain-containing protein [Neokomagataea]QDH25525.1 TOBE domain-containing protein [Neokomagataea tanensis]
MPPSTTKTVSALSKNYFQADDLRIALQEESFSLNISRGETLILFGTDMPALSVLVDIISGFHPSLGETLTISGKDISSLPTGERRLSLVSNRENLFPHLSVCENVEFACLAQQQDKKSVPARANHLLSLLALDGVRTKYPRNLSDEEKLRTKLAQSLARSPDLLILDDILAGLSVATARRIEFLLTRLQKALALTILRTESRQESALRSGGYIAFFSGRRLLQVSSPADLYERPETATVATLFGGSNALVGQIIDDYDDVYTIHLACGGVVEACKPLSEKATASQVGDTCLVCVRPDRISPFFGKNSLQEESEHPPVRGILTEVLHLGVHVRMIIRCDNGIEIELHRPSVQAQRIPKLGTAVELAWPASHALAFPLEADLY